LHCFEKNFAPFYDRISTNHIAHLEDHTDIYDSS